MRAIEWLRCWIARSRLKEAKRLRAVAAAAIREAEVLEALVKTQTFIREAKKFIREADHLSRGERPTDSAGD